MTTTAYSYSRVSSLGQTLGTGIERQIEAAKRYCEANGLTLSDEIFADEGKSAYHGQHLSEGSRLSSFIAAVKSGKVKKGSVLIVEALDRLSREEMSDAVSLFQSILKMGIEIVTLTDNRRYTQKSNLTDWIISLIGFQAANDYSAKLSMRVGAAWKKKRESGDKNKASYPAWLSYDKEKKEFSIIEERANVVRRVFKEFNSGLGYTKLARKLNDDGIKTAQGKKWSHVTVRFTLTQFSAIGEYRPKTRGKHGEKIETDIIHKGYYPAIVSESEFYKAYNRIKNNPPKEGPPAKDETENLFSGLFRCGYCGSSMGFAKRRKLACWGSVHNSECVKCTWGYDEFELPLLAEVKEVFHKRKEELNIPVQEEIEGLTGKISEIKTRIKRLTTQLENLDDPSEIIERINALTAQKNKIQSEIDSKKQQNKELSEIINFGFEIDNIRDTTERKQIQRLIRSHVKLIKVYTIGETSKLEKFKIERDELLKKGKSLVSAVKKLLHKYDPPSSRYMTIILNNPIVRDGKEIKEYNVRVEAMEPTESQNKAWEEITQL